MIIRGIYNSSNSNNRCIRLKNRVYLRGKALKMMLIKI